MSNDVRESLSAEVIRAIAQVEGVDPMDLEYSLYDFIDPEVLDALGETGRGQWELDFVVDSHLVTVDSDGHLFVDGRGYRNGGVADGEAVDESTRDHR